MLIELSIENFGPFRDKQTLSFEATKDTDLDNYYVVEPIKGLRLLKLCILYGPNASGKSFVLFALENLRLMISKPPLQKDEGLYFNPFQMNAGSLEKPTSIEISFVKNEIRYTYFISWNAQMILHEKLQYFPKGRQAAYFERATDKLTGKSVIEFGSTVQVTTVDKDVLTGNVLSNVSVLGAYRRSNIFLGDLAGVVEWFIGDLMSLVSPSTSLTEYAGNIIERNPSLKTSVLKFLKLADLQIEGLEIETYEPESTLHDIKLLPLNRETMERMEQKVKGGIINKKTIKFLHEIIPADGPKQQFWLSMANESDGTMRYFGLSALLVILIAGNRIISIDELESSLHPDLMKHFLLQFLINTKKSQMLVSTHNALLLDDKEILRPDVIWFTEKANDGSSSLYALSDFDSKIYRKGGSILGAYKSGRLGAKPDTIHMPVALN
jgi:AAA15 family ATPase/GTPase